MILYESLLTIMCVRNWIIPSRAASLNEKVIKMIKRPASIIALSDSFPEVNDLANSYEAACLHLEKAAQQSVQLTALRRGLVVSIFINVILLAVLAYSIGGN